MSPPAETSRDTYCCAAASCSKVATLVWNVVGIVVLAIAAVNAHSVALAGIGLDSLIRSASAPSCCGTCPEPGTPLQRQALRLIGFAFLALSRYLTVQTIIVFVLGYHPQHSPLGIAWTALTVATMFALAASKHRTGHSLSNPALTIEGRVTTIDALLACAVLLGLVLNTAVEWWWADPTAGLVIVY